jgi:SAM-dependent methyltransferase
MKENSIYPAFIARFYNNIYEHVRTGIDTEFYLQKIKNTKGPVLELGVGTGRFFIEALKNGADIYGIDISPSMIEILRNRIPAKERKRVTLMDAARLNLPVKFDLIIAPFRVFSHLISVDQQLKVLNHIYTHLTKEGIFIFDLFIPDPKVLADGIPEHIDFEGEYKPGKKFKRLISAKPDIINQISQVTMKIIWEDEVKENSEEWSFPMRFYYRYELEHLISLSKLKLVEILGDFSGNKLNPESKDFIVICKR